MSWYSFIASDYKLPIIDNPKVRIITVKEAIALGIKQFECIPLEEMDPNTEGLLVENEDDLYELTIGISHIYEDSVRWYTGKPFIYTVDFRYTKSRAKQLFEYLKENINEGQQLELWSILLYNYCNGNNVELENIEPVVCNYEEFNLNNINQMYDWKNEIIEEPSCIVIKR